GARMLKIVVMKLIELMIDEAPARCSAKMTMSTDGPGWPPGPAAESGGYTVQPTAAPAPLTPCPAPTMVEPSSSRNAGINSQKLMLFMRGKAISGAPIIHGRNQLP